MMEEWKPIASAPKDRYLIGYDPGLKSPIIIIWNVEDGRFDAVFGFGDEEPTHWMPMPPLPETKR